MKYFLKWRQGIIILFLLMMMGMSHAYAAVQSPETLLRGVSQNMIQALEKNKSNLKSRAVIDRIVNNILVPHFDLNRMSAMVVGRRYWFKATPAQRGQFIQQFKRLVINTYSTALAAFNGDKIRFYPLRVNYSQSNTVVVRSVIIRPSGQRIPVSYNVIRKGDTWKIYDFNIENVSMVISYRAQFSNLLSSRGLAGLIHKLQSYNRQH